MARTPIHPGEHLAEELKELRISAAELARQIDVPVNRVTSIMNGQRAITADTALRLGHWFGTSPEFWLNLQKLYELRLAREEVGDRDRRSPPRLILIIDVADLLPGATNAAPMSSTDQGGGKRQLSIVPSREENAGVTDYFRNASCLVARQARA